MKPFIVLSFSVIGLSLAGCNNLTMGPTPPYSTTTEYSSRHPSPLSHGPTSVHFEPNETISTDELLQDRIKGKIKQAFPDKEMNVLVDRDRIIVSGLPTDNEPTAKRIREAVGKLSNKRKLVIVTEDVFRMYHEAHEKKH
jgi:hypothetical protein